MAVIIPPPTDLTYVEDCADWLELVSLVADDRNASAGDLERLLRRAGVFGGAESEDTAIEQACGAVFALLEKRAAAVGNSYPYFLDQTVLTRREGFLDDFIPYVFCLCLSYFRSDHPEVENVNPRLLFEHLSASALEGYLATSDVLVFGTGRKAEFEKSGFVEAINKLVSVIQEGGGFKDQPTLSKKDDHLDVVGVKHFPDVRYGKLIVFGQCATGNNWEGKLSEMNPDAFCRQWLAETVTSTPSLVKTFFVPFIVPEVRWRYVCNYAGIMFERLRVAKYASAGASVANSRASMVAWIQACLV